MSPVLLNTGPSQMYGAILVGLLTCATIRFSSVRGISNAGEQIVPKNALERAINAGFYHSSHCGSSICPDTLLGRF